MTEKISSKTICIAAVTALVIFAVIFAATTLNSKSGNDTSWEDDAADRLEEHGGWIFLDDGSDVRYYAHLKSTTSIEYKNGAFYVTDPNGSVSGTYILPREKVVSILTA